MKTIDLTPFGFTPTESLVYTTLLRLGPTTGYAVALASHLARANVYGALEGLVTRGAATRAAPATRPVRYRPTDPQALLAHLATLQGEALDRLTRALRDASHPLEPATKEVGGARAVANLILQLVARAERRVEGVLAAELWRPTLPAWRHATRSDGGGASVELRIAGDVPSGAEGIVSGSVAADAPTILVVDGAQTVVTTGVGDAISGVWSSHPLIVMLARRALAFVVVLILAAAAACRAPEIPVERRYPAGSPFHAQYRVVDGTRLRMIDTGHGAPVVFIHGFGASLYTWRKTLAPVLDAGYRVIAFDNRGFGFSDKPAPQEGGTAHYTNGAYARLVVALLDSLDLPAAVLVGHSMGGAIAAEVAVRYPDRVRGLVLIDAAGFGVRFPPVLKVGRWPGAGRVAATLRGRWMTEQVLRSTYADPSKVTDEDVDQYYGPVAEPGYDRALRGVLRQFRFDTLVGRLGALAAPTLVVWGAEDSWIPVRVGSRLATELPRGAFVIVPRTGHAAADESPDEVNALLIPFLKEGLPRVPENLAWSTPSLRSSRSSSPPIPRTPQRSAN